ncbi:hypothetical protein MB84_27700 (plasmid) [Pandoraea oxalativorans]|uniref:Uncharacterized protein n=2 Tax=Pandoraea oxalativorans TaxID=573737 RepID=A0A0G3IBI1_9BURK|nr:hypothetical protein MB84_27700 [Pandoraea oxalativorans]
MMHPDAYRDDLKKLTYSGGGLYLEKGDAAIGRLWKTEDRRNPIISYSSSIQANAYILFPQEILDDLSKELSDSEYNSLMENIQLKTFLKGKYKVQGIIKIAEDNTYEMRLLGGKKEYRVLFDLNSIKNNKNLFFDNTLAYCASKVFYHNGKTDKTVAKLGEKKIKEMVSILSSSDIYIKPSLNF